MGQRLFESWAQCWGRDWNFPWTTQNFENRLERFCKPGLHEEWWKGRLRFFQVIKRQQRSADPLELSICRKIVYITVDIFPMQYTLFSCFSFFQFIRCWKLHISIATCFILCCTKEYEPSEGTKCIPGYVAHIWHWKFLIFFSFGSFVIYCYCHDGFFKTQYSKAFGV